MMNPDQTPGGSITDERAKRFLAADEGDRHTERLRRLDRALHRRSGRMISSHRVDDHRQRLQVVDGCFSGHSPIS
jgi:hypothetical protein